MEGHLGRGFYAVGVEKAICTAIPLLAEEGWREAPGWSVRRNVSAGPTTPSPKSHFGASCPQDGKEFFVECLSEVFDPDRSHWGSFAVCGFDELLPRTGL